MASVPQTVSRRTSLSCVGAATGALVPAPPLMEPGRFANNASVSMAMHVRAFYPEGGALLLVPPIATVHNRCFVPCRTRWT